MASISNDQIQAAYRYGKLVYNGHILRKDAVAALVGEHAMNPGSALNFVGNYKQMRKGKAYQRTLSREATEIFFTNFQADYGDAGLQNAIDASRLHADYYESLGKGKKKVIRELCDEYEALIIETSQATLADILNEFEEGVSKSLRDSSSARKKRLASYDGKVTERVVTQKVFVRNHDVVAETLIRSNGICEFCEQPAPFNRKKDGRPYLEVHHRVPLAEGGKDRLENTLALCPNCHREAHFGKDSPKYSR
ncbi:HNH endonuclease signature motif containing protein [uncultured Ruegeria sp.]|uniref:HNH endonuclease n=1 Tax=uncultured Ruegeria sp. TaxID=259304 RepID=UPI0026313784|nr:HNH endonuclease signature motif containing protein [uncultured Ruegeria sp.]